MFLRLNRRRLTAMALLCGAQISTCHLGWGAEGTNDASVPNPNALRYVHGACTQTMTNIYAALLKLVGSFPVLDGFSNAHIVSAEPIIWRNETWEQHCLNYLKNVKTEKLKPGANGTIPQQDEIQLVEENGARLEIYLVQRAAKIARTHEYLLPYGAGDNQLRLIYNLEANPPDPALQKAVEAVIERQVALLKQTLQAR